MNTDKVIARNFMEQALDMAEKEYSASGIDNNINLWYQNKQHFLDKFRLHPNWVEDILSIVIPDAEEGVSGAEDATIRNLDDFIRNIRNQYGADKAEFVEQNRNMFLDDRVQAKHVEWLGQAMPEITGVNVGMKMTKLIRKICDMNNVDIEEKDDVRLSFVRYSESVSVKPIIRPLVFSLNPADYLHMSNGNSWSSCQALGRMFAYGDERYDGDFVAGILSYMCDRSTIVSYTVAELPDNIKDLPLQPKLSRQLFHVASDGWSFIQGRMYPSQYNKYRYRERRRHIHEILASLYGFDNMWGPPKRSGNRIAYTAGGYHYADYENFSEDVVMSFIKPIQERLEGGAFDEHVSIGSDAYCILCGERELDDNDRIVCRHCS